MNAERVPFEAPKERSRVCFGGFRRSCEDAPCGGTESFTSLRAEKLCDILTPLNRVCKNLLC